MDRKEVEWHIPFVTFVKIFCALLFVYATLHLWQIVLLLMLAGLIAITLNPLVGMLERRGLSHRLALSTVVLSYLGVAVIGVVLLVPPLVEEMSRFAKELPNLREKIVAAVPKQMGIDHWVEKTAKTNLADQGWVKNLLMIGQSAVGGLSAFVMVVVFSIYLLIDGRDGWQWLLPYFSAENRKKLEETATEVTQVVYAYVIGQAITSLLASVYAFGVLFALKVPAALILAVLAGLLDIIPILGFFLFIIPAALLALTVKPVTALIVIALYFLYHLIENYIITPRVYGKRMRLSTLVVLVALLAAGELTGIVGAILILPIVASYPIIERIWLGKYVGHEAVMQHASQAAEIAPTS